MLFIGKENPRSDFHDVEVVPIFISIDCRRDTFEEINEYCQSFHPSLIGLSGTEQQVDNAAKSFRLYFSKGMVGTFMKLFIFVFVQFAKIFSILTPLHFLETKMFSNDFDR